MPTDDTVWAYEAEKFPDFDETDLHPKGATYNRRWVCCWFGDVSHIEFSPACTECKRWLP